MALSTAATELRATLGALGLTQHRAAQLFGVGPRSVRRWQHGDRRVPCGVGIVLRLLAAQKITIRDVEEAAAPAQTNRSAAPDPQPAIADPKPEPRVSAPTVDSEPVTPKSTARAPLPAVLTTAEKVLALAPGVCRWPYGDPRDPDFHFCCGASVVAEPYCEHHRALAYLAPRTG